MNRADIDNAFSDDLIAEGLGFTAIVWQNVLQKQALVWPYLEVAYPDADRVAGSLRGTLIRETGSVAAIVVVEADTGVAQGKGLASAVANLFPVARRMPITGGVITIRQPPQVRGGYRDGNDWRIPVMIPYRASNK